MSKTNASAGASRKKTPAVPVLAAPPGVISKNRTALVVAVAAEKNDPFGAFVAAQQKAADAAAIVVSEPRKPASEKVKAAVEVKDPLRVKNGQREYSPGTGGRQVFDVADKLQAMHPEVPLTSTVMRVALPLIPAASISAAMSHWRKFNGKLNGAKPPQGTTEQ